MTSTFTQAQVDAGILHVIEHGAVDRANTIRYTAVFIAAGMPVPQELHQGGEGDIVTAFMRAFHFRCRDLQLPPLDSIVVHVAGGREGRPGKGYFKVNSKKDPFAVKTRAETAIQSNAFWEREKQEVRAWGIEYRQGRISHDVFLESN